MDGLGTDPGENQTNVRDQRMKKESCFLNDVSLSWPGLFDNTVAGGIPAGIPPFEALAKECEEEASIAEDIVRKYARSVGVVSYFFQ